MVPLSGPRSLLTVTGGVLSGDRNYEEPYLAATFEERGVENGNLKSQE